MAATGLAERLKTFATILGALVSIFGALSGFWPQIREAAIATSAFLLVGPPWVKYVFLVVAIGLSGLAYLRIRPGVPMVFEVLECRLVVRIHDAQAARTTVTESSHICSKIDGADSFTHRQWTRGPAGDPKIWSEGYATSVKTLDQEMGLTCYALEFRPPLRRGQKLWQHYECEVENTFPERKEYFEHVPSFGEKSLRMTIIFPSDRQPTRVRALWLLGDGLREHGVLPLATNGFGCPQAEWRVRRSAAGCKYRIEWEW